jgi:hypothetical protein
MPMTYKIQQYQETAVTLLENLVKKSIHIHRPFYPTGKCGEPILLHPVRCDPFAVDHHSFMGHAWHLQRPRFVNKSSYIK